MSELLKRNLKIALHVATLVLVAVSPFLVYAGVQIVGGDDEQVRAAVVAQDRVVVLAEGDEGLESLTLLDRQAPLGALAVTFPAATALDRGRRLAQVYAEEGPAALAGLFTAHVEVPSAGWMVIRTRGDARQGLVTASNIGDAADQVLRELQDGEVRRVDAPGTWTGADAARAFAVDAADLRSLLETGLVPSPAASPATPTATPTASPSASPTLSAIPLGRIRLEVLNAGGPAGSAAAYGAHLRKLGFDVEVIGNYRGKPVEGIVVHYAKQKRYADEVVKRMKGAGGPLPLPRGVTTGFDVVVLIGRDVRLP